MRELQTGSKLSIHYGVVSTINWGAVAPASRLAKLIAVLLEVVNPRL